MGKPIAKVLDGTERKDIAKVLRDLRGHRRPDGSFGPFVTLDGDRAEMVYRLLTKMRRLL